MLRKTTASLFLCAGITLQFFKLLKALAPKKILDLKFDNRNVLYFLEGCLFAYQFFKFSPKPTIYDVFFEANKLLFCSILNKPK